MEIREFAEHYRLKVRHDSCADAIIPGKPYKASRPEDRNHVYENGDDRLGVYLSFSSARSWNLRRSAALAAGFTLNQNAHAEGTLLFDPKQELQARLAIRFTGIKRVRKSTPAQLAALAKARSGRQDPCAIGPSAA